MDFRKINKDEFDKLKRLFPGDDTLWKKYKKQRMNEFDNNEIDIFILEDNNLFIGEITVNYVSHNLKTETIPNKRVYLEAFRIDKLYQGNGLGQELLNNCIQELIAKGYLEFTIGVEDDNKLAKHIYYKYGFKKEIDKGFGDEFDPSTYKLYLKTVEKVDVYNQNKEKTGKIIYREKGVSLSKDEFIISITVWIVNSDGKILMTQRKLDKKNGGLWEPTSGLVQSGESSVEGALRELKEEIGIERSFKDIKLVKSFIEESSECNHFRDIYLIKEDISLDQIKFVDGEVINAKYVTIEELNRMIKTGEAQKWLDYFDSIYKEIK